jgi:hypothetical protein
VRHLLSRPLIVFVKLKIFSLDTQVLTSFYCVFAKELIIYIGIFWFYNSALIAKKIAVKELTPDDIGMVDSPFEHINEWESRLASTEYQEFPRGRVVYSNVTRKATIYMDSSLFVKKYKRLLINHFDLADCSVTWKKDSHYQVFSY